MRTERYSSDGTNRLDTIALEDYFADCLGSGDTATDCD